MKRILTVSVLVLMTAAAFASDVSWGVGATGGLFLNEKVNSLANPAVSAETVEASLPLGIKVYIDAAYFQMDLGFLVRTLGRKVMNQTIEGSTSNLLDKALGETKGYISVAMMGKCPFPVGLATVTASLGFQMDANIMIVDSAGTDLRALMEAEDLIDESMYWIRAGAGLDIPFNYRGYVRSELIVGCKIPTVAERAAYSNVTKAGFNAFWLTIQPDLSLCVGWRL